VSPEATTQEIAAGVAEREHRVDLVAQLEPGAQLVGVIDDQHGVPLGPAAGSLR
jgi:hypothetical protein